MSAPKLTKPQLHVLVDLPDRPFHMYLKGGDFRAAQRLVELRLVEYVSPGVFSGANFRRTPEGKAALEAVINYGPPKAAERAFFGEVLGED